MMYRQMLTQSELAALVASMEALDIDEELDMDEEDCGDVDDNEEPYEDDGQPSEYDEWQDFYGGDDWDQGQYDGIP